MSAVEFRTEKIHTVIFTLHSLTEEIVTISIIVRNFNTLSLQFLMSGLQEKRYNEMLYGIYYIVNI